MNKQNNNSIFKKNASFFIILFLVLGIIYILSINKSGKNITPIEYRNLNEECQKYGIEKYGETTYSKNTSRHRTYKYSIILNTCVLDEHTYIWNYDNLDYIILTDIYTGKHIGKYWTGCLSVGTCRRKESILGYDKKISEIFNLSDINDN